MLSIHLCVWGIRLLRLILSVFLRCCQAGAQWQKKKLAKQVKSFSLLVSNCSRVKLCHNAFTIQVMVRGLDVLDYFKLITGWTMTARTKFRKALTSEIWDFFYFLHIDYSETAPCRSRLPAASLLVFKVRLRVQITPNANWQGSQMNVKWLFFFC